MFLNIGGLGLAWTLAWFCMVHDTPFDHPRISAEEKAYIIQTVGLNEKPKEKEVRQFIQASLPPHIMPRHFFFVYKA